MTDKQSRRILWKISLDMVLTALFLAALGFHATGGKAHEWIGLAWCILVIFHCVWNRGWFVALFRGKYTPRRGVNTAVILLLALGMATIGVSGAMNSSHLLGSLHLDGDMRLRQIHSFAVYWSLVLVGVHAGLQWRKVAGVLRKVHGQSGASFPAQAILRFLTASLAILGVWAFFERSMGAKLFFGSSFDFWEPSRPDTLFYAANFAILSAYAVATRGLLSFAKRLSGSKITES